MTSLVSIAIGATALLGKALELVKLVKHLIHAVGSHQEEIEKTDDKTELQKKIDKWMNAPISGPDKSMGDMARNMSMRK
jgi:Tat protein secretion system quality control protein TatD with DNase activity